MSQEDIKLGDEARDEARGEDIKLGDEARDEARGEDKDREEGIYSETKGREEGMEKVMGQTAINLLRQGCDNSIISQVASLSIDKLATLKHCKISTSSF